MLRYCQVLHSSMAVGAICVSLQGVAPALALARALGSSDAQTPLQLECTGSGLSTSQTQDDPSKSLQESRPVAASSSVVTSSAPNHSRAIPVGAVWTAAVRGDVSALSAALHAGGSTEETNEVSASRRMSFLVVITFLSNFLTAVIWWCSTAKRRS